MFILWFSIENEVKRILKSYKESGYDKHIRPNIGGEPVNVGMTIHIHDISFVSPKKLVNYHDLFELLTLLLYARNSVQSST